MSKKLIYLFVLYLKLIKIEANDSNWSPRGIDPTRHFRFGLEVDGVKTIECDGGKIKLKLNEINDNVCDCQDESDEPGTSACMGGTFFCQNKKFKSKRVPSIFVDDGFCDCCDGSDEPKGVCVDSCSNDAKIFAKEKEKNNSMYQRGLQEKSRIEKRSLEMLTKAKKKATSAESKLERASDRLEWLEDAQKVLTQLEEIDKQK
eukprot:Trichotokara_eunicae@DN1414_c0_g1_i1.p1